MNKLFGANWKTTVSGIGAALFGLLTMLAALPYSLGDIATIIPPEWKTRVVTVSIIAAFLLRAWNAMQQKDKGVTGGTVQQTADGSVANPVPVGGVSKSISDTLKAEPMA